MNFLEKYVIDWMNRDDEQGPTSERLNLYFCMIRNTTDYLKEVLQGIADAKSVILDLDDAYSHWGSVYREVFFRRGFALVYQTTMQHTGFASEPDAVALALAHSHMAEYSQSEIYQRELSPAEQAVIQEEQENIRRLQLNITQQASSGDKQLISSLLQEMEHLHLLLFQNIKETYFVYGMLHGYRLFSALLAEVGSPHPSPLAMQCG